MSTVRGVPAVFLALAAVLTLAGAAAALWWESLYVDVTVNSGTLDTQLSVHGSGDNEIQLAHDMGEPHPEVKDVSNITCTLGDDGKSIDVVIQNAYPGITYYCDIDLSNTGTIPFKVYSIKFSGNLTDVAEYFGFTNDTIVEGLQLEPGHMALDRLEVTLSNHAHEGAVYTGHVEIVVEQWNEYPTAP